MVTTPLYDGKYNGEKNILIKRSKLLWQTQQKNMYHLKN